MNGRGMERDKDADNKCYYYHYYYHYKDIVVTMLKIKLQRLLKIYFPQFSFIFIFTDCFTIGSFFKYM